jgi:hypothetical protein
MSSEGTETLRLAKRRQLDLALVNLQLVAIPRTGRCMTGTAQHAQSYLTSFADRFNRRHQLDSIVERLAWAAAHAGSPGTRRRAARG